MSLEQQEDSDCKEQCGCTGVIKGVKEGFGNPKIQKDMAESHDQVSEDQKVFLLQWGDVNWFAKTTKFQLDQLLLLSW